MAFQRANFAWQTWFSERMHKSFPGVSHSWRKNSPCKSAGELCDPDRLKWDNRQLVIYSTACQTCIFNPLKIPFEVNKRQSGTATRPKGPWALSGDFCGIVAAWLTDWQPRVWIPLPYFNRASTIIKDGWRCFYFWFCPDFAGNSRQAAAVSVFFSFFPLLFIVLTLASMTINVPGGGTPEDLCHTVHLSSRPHILMLKVSKPSALLPPTDQNSRLGGMSGLTSALSEPGQMKRICW